MPRPKGQMFIVTMVFLVAMIFSVQQLLFQYTALDLSSPPQNMDACVAENMEYLFQQALDSSGDCTEARANVMDLKDHITDTIGGGYSIEILGDLECPGDDWPSSPELYVHVTMTSDTSETKAGFTLSRS